MPYCNGHGNAEETKCLNAFNKLNSHLDHLTLVPTTREMTSLQPSHGGDHIYTHRPSAKYNEPVPSNKLEMKEMEFGSHVMTEIILSDFGAKVILGPYRKFYEDASEMEKPLIVWNKDRCETFLLSNSFVDIKCV